MWREGGERKREDILTIGMPKYDNAHLNAASNTSIFLQLHNAP